MTVAGTCRGKRLRLSAAIIDRADASTVGPEINARGQFLNGESTASDDDGGCRSRF